MNLAKLFDEAIDLLKDRGIDVRRQGVGFGGFSRNVETAQIRRGERGWEIALGGNFVEKHAATPEKLAGVLLHELYHTIHHYESGSPIESLAGNIATDALINAAIHRIRSAFSAVFRDYYPEDQFPGFLLRPDAKPPDPRAVELCGALYHSKNFARQSFYDVLGYALEKLRAASGEALRAIERAFSCAAREGIGKRFRLPGLFSEVSRMPVEAAPGLFQGKVEEVLKAVARESAAGRIIKQFAARTPARGLWPSWPLSRADAAILGAGGLPVFYRWAMPECPASAHLYVDASASMEEELPWICGLVKGLSRYVNTRVFLFSNKVVEVPRDAVEKGRLESTGGTDFDCVIGHILMKKISSAVVITDGHAGFHEKRQADWVRRRHFVVGVVTRRGSVESVKEFATKVVTLS
jgi:hypothetical protein